MEFYSKLFHKTEITEIKLQLKLRENNTHIDVLCKARFVNKYQILFHIYNSYDIQNGLKNKHQRAYMYGPLDLKPHFLVRIRPERFTNYQMVSQSDHQCFYSFAARIFLHSHTCQLYLTAKYKNNINL